MHVLERSLNDIDQRETKAATGRFFYNPEDPDESIHSRIINYTNNLFGHYKLNGDLDFMFIQLLRTDGVFKAIELGVPGDNVSLKYNGAAISGCLSPLWEVVIAHEDGRSVNQLMLEGGLHVIQRDFDHQGKRRDVSMQADVISTWCAIETIIEDEITQDYLLNDIPDKYLSSEGSVDTTIYSRCKRLSAEADQKWRYTYNCFHTPVEAKAVLTELFEGEEGLRLQKVYTEGMFQIVNLQKYDTSQAQFYVMVQTLSEVAARLQDRTPDDTI